KTGANDPNRTAPQAIQDRKKIRVRPSCMVGAEVEEHSMDGPDTAFIPKLPCFFVAGGTAAAGRQPPARRTVGPGSKFFSPRMGIDAPSRPSIPMFRITLGCLA